MLNNSVFQFEGKTYRFLGVFDNKAVCFDLGSKGHSTRCERMELTSLLEMERSGRARVVEDPYREAREKPIKGKSKERAEKNYEIILPLISDGEQVFREVSRGKKIKEIAKAKGVTVALIYRLLRRWWQYGQSPNAMAPSYGHNGGSRKYTRVTGRPSKSGQASIIVTEETKGVFREICEKYLLVPNYLSVTKAYEEYLTLCRNRGLKKATLAQFRYFYYSNYPTRERTSKQNTEVRFEKDLKTRTGTVYDIAIGPGSIYEIDSTLADVFLVSSNGKTVIGRPTLYLVTDTYSGMIVGVHVSIEPSQYKVGAEALLMAGQDKKSYCEKMGLPITEADWPCHGLPSRVVADNAEFSTEQIEHFARAYGITVTNTRPYRGDDKGTVESSIGQVQHELASLLTGIPDKVKLKKAGGKDKRLEATLTLEEYRRLVLVAVLIANRRVRAVNPPGYPADAIPSPLAIWSWAQNQGKATLANPTDEKLLKIMLLPHQKATISRDGINVKGIRYRCREAEERGWLDRKSGATRPDNLKMVVDPCNVECAWLFPDPEKSPLLMWPCNLAAKSSILKGLSLEEACRYVSAAKIARDQAEQNHHEYASQMREIAREIVKRSIQRDLAMNPRGRDKIEGTERARLEERFIEEAAKRKSTGVVSVMDNLDQLELQTEEGEKEFGYPGNIEDIPK